MLIPQLFSGYFSLTPLITSAVLIAGVAFFTLAIFSGCLFNKHRNQFWAILLITALSSIFFIFNMLELVCYYLTAETFNLGFFYHFNIDALSQASLGRFAVPILISTAGLLIALGLFYYNSKHLVKRKYYHSSVNQKKTKIGRFIYKLVFVGFFVGGFIYCDAAPVKFFKMYHSMYDKGIIKYDAKKMMKYSFPVKFVKNGDVVIRENAQKNVIFIFLEGFDRAFLNQTFYPNLTPNLNKLINDSTDNIKVTNFTNISQAPNAYFTIAGTYSALTGAVFSRLHLSFSEKKLVDDEYSNRVHNSGFSNTIANEFSSVPLILNKANYYQIFMKGPSLKFAGTNVFVENQKFDEGLSVDNLQKYNFKKGQWGFYDKDLFRIAFEKYLKLSSGTKPFNLTLTTVDTHDPGLPNPGGLKYKIPKDFAFSNYSEKLLNAIYDSDFEVVKFIKKISKTKFAQNTVMVLVSDHCVRGSDFKKNHKQKNIGGMTFMIVEFGQEGDKNISTAGATFDVGPTVLGVIGVESNYKFPIGENLLSKNVNKSRLEWSKDKERIWESFCRHYTQNLGAKIDEIAVCSAPYLHIKINNGLQVPVFVNKLAKIGLPKENMLFLIEMSNNNKILAKKNIIQEDFAVNALLKNNVKKYIILAHTKLLKNKKLIPNTEFKNGYALVFIHKKEVKYKIVSREKINDLKLELQKN